MSPLRLLCLCALAATACTGQTAADKPAAQPAPSPMKETTEAAPNVIIHTNYGDMTVEFWPDVAPKTVANFMIQGGCPNSKVGARGVAGTGSPGYQIKAEFNNRAHVRGVLSMARSADPDSAGSQFFICHGNADFLNNKYTAFGKLVSGQDVLDKIAAIPCVGQERSTPTERVEIKSVEIVGEAPAKDAKAK